MIEEGLVEEGWLWRRITEGLAALIHSLTLVAMIRYLWRMFSNLNAAGTAPLNSKRQLKKFGGNTSADYNLALKAGPATEPRYSGSSGFVNGLVDSGAPRSYFDDAIISKLRYKSAKYRVLDVSRKIPTARGY